MYHYVKEAKSENSRLRYLTVDQFKKQLDFFDKKFGFMTIEEFIYNFKNKNNSDKVLLTFDDGLLDHYQNVFPILNERNIKGLFFIPSSILKKNKILNVHRIHYLLSRNNAKKIYKRH